MGDAVAHVSVRNFPIPIEYVGTKDTFGESGKPADLLKKYGLDTPDVIKAAEKVIAKKSS
jgi:transketolase